MAPITRRRLAALGLTWPLPNPSNEDEPINIERVATELYWEIIDNRSPERPLQTQLDAVTTLTKRLDALAIPWRMPATAVPAPAPAPPLDVARDVQTIALPITKRKLASLGLEWPWPFPFDPDEPLDLARAMTDLVYGDVMDYTGGRGDYLATQRAQTKAIIQRLDELSIGRQTEVCTPAPAQPLGIPWKGRPAAPPIRVAGDERITLRELCALGLSYPTGPVPAPEADDEVIDLRRLSTRLEERCDDKSPERHLEQWRAIDALRARLATMDAERERVRAQAAAAPAAVVGIARPEPTPRAVLDAPDDIAPRLAFANGRGSNDPRAELIRVQWEASALPPYCPKRALLDARAKAIVDANRHVWERSLAPFAKSCTFARGFIEAIEIEATAFAAEGASLFELEPIRRAAFIGAVGPLARAPAVGRLRAIECSGDPAALITGPHVEGLRSLALSRGPAAQAIVAVSKGALLPALDELVLDSVDDAPAAIAALFTGPLVPRLRALHVSARDWGSTRLFAEATFTRLERLTMRKPMSLHTLGTLVAPELVELEIAELYFGAHGGAALASAVVPKLRTLRLDLTDSTVAPSSIAALATAPWLAQLESLSFGGKELESVALGDVLARTGAALRAVSVRQDRGVGEAVARAPSAHGLVTVGVGRAADGREVDAILAAAPRLRGLRFIGGAPTDGAATAALERAGFARVANGIYARRLQ